MKILIVTVFFPPQNAIASQRPYVWAREWARAGHDVTVLTIAKDMSKLDLTPKPFEGFRVVETRAGRAIEILRRRRGSNQTQGGQALGGAVRAEPPAGRRGLGRGLQEWLRLRGFLSSVRLPDVFDLWIPNVRRALNKEFNASEFDVIVSTFGPPASLRAGLLAKRRWPKAKWIIDFRDLWTENHVYPGFWPFTWWEKRLETRFLLEADAVTTVSDPLAQSLRLKTPRPVAVFTNGFDPEESFVFSESAPRSNSKTLQFVYTGSLHPTQRNPGTFLQALANVVGSGAKDSRFEVRFAGPRESFVEEMVGELGLNDVVHFEGPLTRKDALKLQSEAAVLLFFEMKRDAANDGVLTGKLFEYLATGRPIWAFGIDASSNVGRLLEENTCGRAFGEDLASIEAALRELQSVGPLQARDVSRANDIVQKFNRKVIAGEMLRWIERGFDRKR